MSKIWLCQHFKLKVIDTISLLKVRMPIRIFILVAVNWLKEIIFFKVCVYKQKHTYQCHIHPAGDFFSLRTCLSLCSLEGRTSLCFVTVI